MFTSLRSSAPRRIFSPTWSCVSLPRATSSSRWKLHIFVAKVVAMAITVTAHLPSKQLLSKWADTAQLFSLCGLQMQVCVNTEVQIQTAVTANLKREQWLLFDCAGLSRLQHCVIQHKTVYKTTLRTQVRKSWKYIMQINTSLINRLTTFQVFWHCVGIIVACKFLDTSTL